MLFSVLRLAAIVVAATAPEPPPGPLGLADWLVKLAALHERGALTDAEFAKAKALQLGTAVDVSPASAAAADVVDVPARRARNETYCGRAGRGSFRCRGRGRTKTCWADETCQSNGTHTRDASRATPGEQLWMTRVMDYAPFAVVVERDGWRRSDPLYVRGTLDAPGLVFVKSERPILEKFLDDVLPGFQHPFVLYTGNADLTIPYQRDKRAPNFPLEFTSRLKSLANDARLRAWYAENLDEVWHPKVIPSLLGFFARRIRRPGTELNKRMWASTAHRQSTRRARRVIATYRMRGGPQFDDRRHAVEVAQTLPDYHTGPVGEGGWLKALGSASHVLCVHGGGFDLNPRLFEALWMGALPIVKRSPVREVALAPYPIVWIDDWEDLRTLDLAGTEALEARARAVDETLYTERHWLATLRQHLGPQAPASAQGEASTPTHDPAAARCYAKRYNDVERHLCPRGQYHPSCAEKLHGHYVSHGAAEGRVYGCSGERDHFRDLDPEGANCYATRYADLREQFCTPDCDAEKLQKHFNDPSHGGNGEGRIWGCGEPTVESRWIGLLMRAPRRPDRIVGFGGPVGRPQSGLNNAKDCLFQFVKVAASVGARVSVESLHWNTRAPYRGPTVAHEKLWDVDHWNAYITKHGGPQKVGLALLVRQPPTHIVSAPGYHNHLSLNTIPTRQQGPGNVLQVAHFHRALRPTKEILAIAASVTPEPPYGAAHLRIEDDIQSFRHHKAARVGVQKTFELMLASPPLQECAADVQRLFVAVDLGLVKDSTDAAMLRGRGPFETTMIFGGRDAAASFGDASAIVGAIVDMTVAADAKYFVGGMGISTFDRGVVDMRSTRDQYRAAPATPANCTFMVRRHRGQEPSLRHFTSFP